jgi:hypothetical protein
MCLGELKAAGEYINFFNLTFGLLYERVKGSYGYSRDIFELVFGIACLLFYDKRRINPLFRSIRLFCQIVYCASNT